MQRIFEVKETNGVLYTRCYDIDDFGRVISDGMAWRASSIAKSETRLESIILAAQCRGFSPFHWIPENLVAYMYKNI